MRNIVSVIIVSYNGARLLRACLTALEAQTRAPDEVVVVDNGSSDHSVKLVQQEFPWVRVIEAGANLGFSGGNNLGIRNSTGDLLVLLNNDTIPGPGFVERIVEPLERDPALAAVAGVLVFRDRPKIVASAGIDVYADGLALDHGLGRRWDTLAAESPVFGPSGGAAAFRRRVLFEVDLFPEPFFLYLEDADLAWRLRLRARETVAAKGAWALHEYSASAGGESSLKDYYLARNRAWTLLRCWPACIWRRCWFAVLRYEVMAIGFQLYKRRWASLRGRFDGWRSIRNLRTQRTYIQSNVRASGDELLYWVRPPTSARDALSVRRAVRQSSSEGRD